MPIKSIPTDVTVDTLPDVRGDVVPSISPNTLRGNVASLSGCISMLSFVDVCYGVGDNEVDVSVKLVGVTLGKCELAPANPQCTLGGGAFGLKAQVTPVFDFSIHVLQITAEACAPFRGCTSGSTSVQL